MMNYTLVMDVSLEYSQLTGTGVMFVYIPGSFPVQTQSDLFAICQQLPWSRWGLKALPQRHLSGGRVQLYHSLWPYHHKSASLKLRFSIFVTGHCTR